ncbi:cysteine--tRNA ligase [Candidatus Roizmanbacteria bacterium RIFCSPLOWO2_12_FULL_40_12]|uniref:Cysteine--tRNA ligase n=1 Tax=Candidatus Roizmanbacteria bacterium RIFCSPLOWO2_01_FULL_40_42 TaxID=1802066 RepID=A0A1F7J4E2_9BACT|nr:MAG: cysteine--tRNA ligase [Candidatus Roizmanbacteria bacterium RIFCSPHIGHO2_01_FULL_40_98]OGK27250.1 MAG: cysteine--tRNA ligase [Candidatus Roizmanbacteria bacterium RIFCSPHIGHO2_02_FULL_40_53]OGK30878.1 MAG: cysteine--tRNA ligase [Candidatus Roizmanbacteria bacterium RIFCSPHIGHO2_12_41_18]OGK36355.1 MAG: cysteine--tRNA ligase [Candidatus Roizmanbacteria bacterium RIFCSPHIGHO2_12_FULL_40_130]OGK50483.1 MAG: cysteine--tRNA ligase [Candidatus Roizmanbacteria bacterium RIFCSPLOWO2_01_FULL_40_
MLLFNTLTKKKEKLKTFQEKKVQLYVCGITPYDTTHLGHAFLYIFFDVFYRYLIHKGYDVNYVQNVTDIDDDILKRANEEKRDWKELGNYWTKEFLDDYKSLNMIMPTHYVKATETMDTIITMIRGLEQKGFTYIKDKNVYFQISKFSRYGELSGLGKAEMLKLAQERGGNPDDPCKKDPLDFILWQHSKKGEPQWESPWGAGRPGWHIECSAMSYKYLGSQIDIHGGGYDLIFPHHESEIAQTESYTGKSPFVRYWVHAAMLEYKGEKMSKSLGNMVFISDLLKKYSPNTIRWVLLSHHYRKEWGFAMNELDEAEKTMGVLQKKTTQKKEGDIRKIENFLENDMDIPNALDYIRKEMGGETLQQTLTLFGFASFAS